MRRKRIHKYKKRKRYLQTAQTLSLVVLGTYGISQLTTPSYALLTDQSQVSEQFSTAFVFPSTVSSMVNQAQDAASKVTDLYESSVKLLSSCQNGKSSDIEQIIQQIQQNASSAQAATNQSSQIVNQLRAYSQQAQNEMNPIPDALLHSHIDELDALQESANKTKQSVARVQTYIDEGFSQAQSFQSNASQTTGKFDELITEANQLLEKQKQAEEEAKKKQLEDEQKAKDKESQTQSQTQSQTDSTSAGSSDSVPTTTPKDGDSSSNTDSQTNSSSSDSTNQNQQNPTNTSNDTNQLNSSNTDNTNAQSDGNSISSNSNGTDNSNQ